MVSFNDHGLNLDFINFLKKKIIKAKWAFNSHDYDGLTVQAVKYCNSAVTTVDSPSVDDEKSVVT